MSRPSQGWPPEHSREPRQGVLIERPGKGALSVAILAADLNAGQARGASTGFEEQRRLPALHPQPIQFEKESPGYGPPRRSRHSDRDHPASGPFRLDAAVVAIGLAAEQARFPMRKQRGQ